MREPAHPTRRSLIAAAPTAAIAGAMPALAFDLHTSSDLNALGKAWTLNLEQQRIAEAETHAVDAAAYAEADRRWDRLLEGEAELSRAIRHLPASTSDDLAIKARVVLREIGLTMTGQQVLDPDEWDSLDVGQASAASLAFDLIRLAGGSAGEGGHHA